MTIAANEKDLHYALCPFDNYRSTVFGWPYLVSYFPTHVSYPVTKFQLKLEKLFFGIAWPFVPVPFLFIC